MLKDRSFRVGTLAFVAGVVIASLSFSAPAPPAEETPQNRTVDELRRERLGVLKSVRDLVDKGYREGVIGFDKVHEARLAYLHAQLGPDGTGSQRIVQDAEAWYQEVAKAVRNGKGDKTDELRAKAYLLEARMALARAQEAPRPPRVLRIPSKNRTEPNNDE
jgi:hypothetical protein